MWLPTPRGQLSGLLAHALPGSPDRGFDVPSNVANVADVLHDEDLQLTLWMCYELSYRGFDGVDPDWEDSPAVHELRRAAERSWVADLRRRVRYIEVEPAEVPHALAELAASEGGPPLAEFLQRDATLEQTREFVVHRSIYQLKEADPHSWAIPRLDATTKSALMEIQADEYGGGRPARMHSELFRATMRALDLNDDYGAYVDQVPATTLAISNLMSLFALHRRWVGALIGQLALYESTSSLPCRKYGNGLRRLGFDTDATRFYDEHVEADSVHEQLAMHDLCGGYAMAHPAHVPDILFGAGCEQAVSMEFGQYLMDRWIARASTVMQPLGLPSATAAPA